MLFTWSLAVRVNRSEHPRFRRPTSKVVNCVSKRVPVKTGSCQNRTPKAGDVLFGVPLHRGEKSTIKQSPAVVARRTAFPIELRRSFSLPQLLDVLRRCVMWCHKSLPTQSEPQSKSGKIRVSDGKSEPQAGSLHALG